ncbi:TatD family hydrolase [Brevibacterium sp. UMB1308A]|uniref:TatD family hydrolase n=1 Tax=Brevibacterium sp. UMB1308A TaxID=3050608 RepID=UPI00254D34FD|nr:TatD family hydrolase [Brevibacterium sp. UMB1308A]MDK8347169.1 TatD family hydrolase [Brevibacterium sp. UMB1308B]MDK8714349.1 TatD family hydrolase [Brevibacterium sp. UMB1308A]
MTTLLDSHYHYDFLPSQERSAFLDELAGAGVEIVAQTLTPSDFVELEAEEQRRVEASISGGPHPSGSTSPRLSVGFHPWNIRPDYERELDIFAQALTRTRFVGEVGLDYVPRRLQQVPAKTQAEVFRRILDILSSQRADGPYVLSIHAVRSASQVCDALEATDTSGMVPIFHRFGGTSDELTRLIKQGGYISVNPAMLATKRGRAYVTQVPADRLLLETDLPAGKEASDDLGSGPGSAPSEPSDDLGKTYARELTETLNATVNTLAALRHQDPDELAVSIMHTAQQLYGARPAGS